MAFRNNNSANSENIFKETLFEDILEMLDYI
jgi:hypothetical protein